MEKISSGQAHTRKVTFGIRVPNSGPLASPESILAVAREAEALCYDSIWVHDHLKWGMGFVSCSRLALGGKCVEFAHSLT
jgi:alkanesulfonate monooxygenase SsuD/methylene tetrahydromethanopterin reductase-like flavin-dependent oxidoreductase (luciferase family)